MDSSKKRALESFSDAISILEYVVDELKQETSEREKKKISLSGEMGDLKRSLGEVVDIIEEKREALRTFEKSIFIPQTNYDALLNKIQSFENIINALIKKESGTSASSFQKEFFENISSQQNEKIDNFLKELKKSSKYAVVQQEQKHNIIDENECSQNKMFLLYGLSGIGVGSIILNAFIFFS